MDLLTSPRELSQYHGCAFVPTMGALHEGHLSLISEAKQSGKPVVVSIFVNPEQFAPDEDLEKYPRNLMQDVQFAESVGADIVFAPSMKTMYPNEPEHIKLPPSATEPQLEDACRPSHFKGVCVAVARLFDLVKPSITVFGLKDYQQYLVIKELIKQEHSRWPNLEIIGADIIRDADGLAMSSRNIFLSNEEHAAALAIQHAIQCQNENDMKRILAEQNLMIEYAVIRDAQTLLAPTAKKEQRALVAVKVGTTRLIDNARVAK